MLSSEIPWGALLILLPLAAAIFCFVLPRLAALTGVVAVILVTLVVGAFGWQLYCQGVYQHAVGGWGAPLGIDLYGDGLSLLMLVMTALVGLAVTLYARSYFSQKQARVFWPLWLLLLAALNALFLSADIFNLYITLEMVGLAAVALVALKGGRDALNGAMRYLLATLLGSLTYLLGVALLYHSYGTVDIALLAERIDSSPVVWAALGLMGAGLLLKTALFPLHFWLPPAHASAPAPISALLSALLVKASFYIFLRLWRELFSPLGGDVALLLGLLGALAILWGSWRALRQTRLKLLVAYSTVAQIGYLFVAFPLAAAAGTMLWNGVSYLMLSHALAKAAMFLAAGNLLLFGGHDRIAELDRAVQRLPISTAAFALAGVSIMGLPPSGGFIGKWLLLEAAIEQGYWLLGAVMVVGGLLASAYIFKVVGYAFTRSTATHEPKSIPASMEWAALLLALSSILLGLTAPWVFALLDIGNPFGGVER
ncbi:MAG: oxidoreductase [Gammaproteobacteria bacterium]|nr:oxidoreductase [Gammaproteobacteria bacterium]